MSGQLRTVLILAGPPGSGKSTLVRSIATGDASTEPDVSGCFEPRVFRGKNADYLLRIGGCDLENTPRPYTPQEPDMTRARGISAYRFIQERLDILNARMDAVAVNDTTWSVARQYPHLTPCRLYVFGAAGWDMTVLTAAALSADVRSYDGEKLVGTPRLHVHVAVILPPKPVYFDRRRRRDQDRPEKADQVRDHIAWDYWNEWLSLPFFGRLGSTFEFSRSRWTGITSTGGIMGVASSARTLINRAINR